MQPMPLHDLISDIHALDRELHRLKEKYNLLSEDFYQLYETGRLRDEVIEEIDDYGRWAALYRMRLRRKAQWDQAQPYPCPWDQLRPTQPPLLDRGSGLLQLSIDRIGQVDGHGSGLNGHYSPQLISQI